MTAKEFIAYYERAYNVKLNTPQLLSSASFLEGYASAKGDETLAKCAENFHTAVRILAELQRQAVSEI